MTSKASQVLDLEIRSIFPIEAALRHVAWAALQRVVFHTYRRRGRVAAVPVRYGIARGPLVLCSEETYLSIIESHLSI